MLGMKTRTLNILTLSLRNTAEDKIEMLAQKRIVRDGMLVSSTGCWCFQISRVSGELQDFSMSPLACFEDHTGWRGLQSFSVLRLSYL